MDTIIIETDCFASMETATVSQSSFTIDCNQVRNKKKYPLLLIPLILCCVKIAWMLNHGQGKSLFLIDEFGKGVLAVSSN